MYFSALYDLDQFFVSLTNSDRVICDKEPDQEPAISCDPETMFLTDADSLEEIPVDNRHSQMSMSSYHI